MIVGNKKNDDNIKPLVLSPKFKTLFDELEKALELKQRVDKKEINTEELYSKLGKTFYAFYGGRGSGKSYTVAFFVILMARIRKENILTVRKYNSTNDASVRALYERIIDENGWRHLFEFRRDRIIARETNSSFMFVGIDVNPNNIKSMDNVTITVIEEANDISLDAFNTLLPTAIRQKRSRMICIWNPKSPRDAIDCYFRSGLSPEKETYTAWVNYLDNPAVKNTNIFEQAEHDKKINYGKYKHIWLGEYDTQTTRRVFNNVEKGVILEKDRQNAKALYGLDFGTNDPNALVKCYIIENFKTKYDRVLYIDRVLYQKGSIDAFMDKMKRMFVNPKTGNVNRNAKIVCDSASPHFISIVQQTFYNAIGAKKGNDSVKAGINWLQSCRIIVDPNCVEMLTEFENYSWKKDKSKSDEHGNNLLLDIPEDRDNHLIDALRYATEDYRLGNVNTNMGYAGVI